MLTFLYHFWKHSYLGIAIYKLFSERVYNEAAGMLWADREEERETKTWARYINAAI